MSDYGFRSKNVHGDWQIDGETTLLTVVHSGKYSDGRHVVWLDFFAEPTIAVRNGVAKMAGYKKKSGGTYVAFDVSGKNVDISIICPQVKTNKGHGVRIYSSAGKPIFDSGNRIPKIIGMADLTSRPRVGNTTGANQRLRLDADKFTIKSDPLGKMKGTIKRVRIPGNAYAISSGGCASFSWGFHSGVFAGTFYIGTDGNSIALGSEALIEKSTEPYILYMGGAGKVVYCIID